MKTLIFIVSVCALTLPALAADVDITAVDKGGGVLGINYTAAVGHGPRGFAILVTLTDAELSSAGDVLSVHPAYNVNIDSAYSQETAVSGSYVIGSGHPIADPGGPGEATFPATTFVISLGVLDQGGNQAAGPESESGVPIELIALQLSGSSYGATVTLAADVSRGGPVVTDNPESTWSVTGITPPPPGPDCWDPLKCPQWCHGDANCDGEVGLPDFNVLKAAWSTTDGIDAAYNPCADFDKSGAVGLTDFNLLKANWSTIPGGPPCS